MKKLMLLCVMLVFAFAVQGQEKEIIAQTPFQTIKAAGDANPQPNVLVIQMLEARKNGDWSTYNMLFDLYKGQMVLPEDDTPAEMEMAPEQNPIMRWNGDRTIYSGNLAYNTWTYDDEAFSVDHHRGDTLRAAVVAPDSTLHVYQSNDNGLTWTELIYWIGATDIYEPEIINDPDGQVYHVFNRRSSNNGDLRVLTDSINGGWYGTWIENSADTTVSYTVCSDRAQYGAGYYLFCAFHVRLGGAGYDEIRFTRSFDEGVNWETPSAIQVTGSANPDLAFGDNDYLYLTRLYYRTNDTINVYVRRSTDEGGNWAGSINVQADTLTKQGPQIAAAHDGSGDVWVAWSRIWVNNANDWDLWYSWTENNGTNWSVPNFVSGAGYWEEVSPSITVYDAGTYYTPYMGWLECDTALNNRSVRMSYWGTDSVWAAESTYNDYTPGLLRPCQTWEAPGYPAIAYAGDNGVNVYYDSWSMSYGVEEGNAKTAPSKLQMQNRPNPFRTNTLLEYNVPVSGKVSLKIFNSLGQEVAKLVDEYKSAGTYTLNWNGLTLPKGVYFAKLQVGTMNATRKIIVQ